MSTALPLRAAAVILWVSALGFGAPCVICIRSLLAGGGIAWVLGFPAYGGGPFEQFGLHTSVPLVAGFLFVCILQGAAGWLLWRGQGAGAFLALAVLPAGAVYWWGFALPYAPILAAASIILILLSRSRLDRSRLEHPARP